MSKKKDDDGQGTNETSQNDETIPRNLRTTHPLITSEYLKHNVGLYIRQSSLKQVEENTGSTDYQRSLVNSALRYGWKRSQVILIEEDLGRSGTSSANRPGWKRMLDLIISGSIKAVITANTSRLSRNLIDLLELLSLAARHAVLLIIDGKVIDPKDDNDIFFSRILGSIAEYENRVRAETMKRARLAKVQRGDVVMGLPVGFLKRADGSITKDPETKDAIDRILQVFREQRSVRRTVMALREQQIKLPSKKRKTKTKGKIIWKEATLDMVRSILVNPAYSGTFAYGRSRAVPELGKTPKGFTVRRPTPEEKWIKFYGKLPAYMTIEEQEEIRQILQANAFSNKHRPGWGSALCQGLLVCTDCGTKLTTSY